LCWKETNFVFMFFVGHWTVKCACFWKDLEDTKGIQNCYVIIKANLENWLMTNDGCRMLTALWAVAEIMWILPIKSLSHTHLISSTKMRSPKSLHNLQNDEGGNYMAETETETVIKQSNFKYNCSQIVQRT
jgi:hypothetical protein